MSSSPSSRRHRHRHDGGTAPPPAPLEPESPPAAAEARDWASLPRDLVLDIFLRLGPREVMLGAEFACKPWRRVALEEPSLWRRIGMESPCDKNWRFRKAGVEKAMKLVAVDRAAGECEAFEGSCDDDDLRDLVGRAPSLKCLCIEHYSDCESGEDLVEALMKLTHLEELEIHFNYNLYDWDESLQSVCQACPHLKKLVLMYVSASDLEVNEDEHCKETIDGEIPVMLQLHTLELYECLLKAKGLNSILDSCPVLGNLHIDGYLNKREMDKELRMKCARVKNLTLPTKSRNDIYWDATDDDEYSSSDTDSQDDYSEDDDSL